MLLFATTLYAQSKSLTRLTIVGNDHVKKSEIKKLLRQKPLPFHQKPAFWIKNPEFNHNLMLQDSDSILVYLQSNGFLYAEVEAIATESKRGNIGIEYRITENSPVLVSSVTVIVNDTIRVDRPRRAPRMRGYEQRRTIEAQDGKIFRDADVYNDIGLINDYFVAQGYLKSHTDFQVLLNEDSSKNESTVEIEYHTETGKVYYIKDYEITGNRNVDTSTVRNQIVFRDSLAYKLEYVTKSRENLMRLGVFRSIQIFPNFIEDTDFVKPTFRFIEKNKWVTTAGLGWGSEERFRAFAQIAHHGMYKKADQQELSIRTSYIEPWNVQFRLIQPAFFHPQITLMINPFIRRENETDYLLDRYGNITTLSYNFLTYWNLFFDYLLEQNNLRELEYATDSIEGIYNQSTYFTKLDFNYSFPRINPYRGFHSISGVGLTEIDFDNLFDYYFLSQEFRYYQPIYNQFIIALRAQAQVMDEIADFQSIPRESRLYLGGVGSVRGYDRRSISPYIIDEDGNIVRIGGRSSLLFSSEARVPIIKNIDVAFLYDAGQVLEGSYDFDINAMSQSVGLGIRYQSPIGRIRFDMAKAIDKSRPTRFYLTIGESF